jgi:hypothetical protein
MNDNDVVAWVRTGRPFRIDTVMDAIEACMFFNQSKVAGCTGRTCDIFCDIMAREDNPCGLNRLVFDDVVHLAANERNVISLVGRLAARNDTIELLSHQLAYAKRYGHTKCSTVSCSDCPSSEQACAAPRSDLSRPLSGIHHSASESAAAVAAVVHTAAPGTNA